MIVIELKQKIAEINAKIRKTSQESGVLAKDSKALLSELENLRKEIQVKENIEKA